MLSFRARQFLLLAFAVVMLSNPSTAAAQSACDALFDPAVQDERDFAFFRERDQLYQKLIERRGGASDLLKSLVANRMATGEASLVDYKNDVETYFSRSHFGSFADMSKILPSHAELIALVDYTSDASDFLNNALRSGKNPYPEYTRILNAALRNLPARPAVVYRGAKMLSPEVRAIYESLKVGDIHTELSFLSTTKDRSTAENIYALSLGSSGTPANSVFLTIKSKSARSINWISPWARENEFLLGSGTRFKVTRTKTESYKLLRIWLEEI